MIAATPTAASGPQGVHEGINTKARTIVALGLLAGAAMLIPGIASATSSSTSTATTTTGTHQTVDIPTDNVLLALAIDPNPSLGDVANIHRSTSSSDSVSSNSNIGTNDALLAIALGRGGSDFATRNLLFDNGFGFSSGFDTGFGTGFGTLGFSPFLTTSLVPGDQSRSTTTSQSVDQSVSFNQDTVLAALALGHGSVSSLGTLGTFDTFGSFNDPFFFGGSGLGSIANVDRTVTRSASTNSNVALDSNDVLAQLALGR